MKKEENKNEQERPTKDLKIDESLLSEEDKQETGLKGPISALIVCGVLIVLIIICIIVILVLNNGQ